MTDERKSGIALIAGSIGGIITMAIHPVAGGPMTPAQVNQLAVISGIAHSIAMVSVLLLFLGACGLSRSIATPDRISFAAIVTFAFACFSVMIAATVSGFIVPAIMKHMARDVPATMHQWQIVIDSIFQINQAFSRIYSVAASVAIILWSYSGLRSGSIRSGIAIYGCIISALIIIGVVSGHLRLDVHGMAAIMVGQAIWFVLLGSQLYSRESMAQAAVR